MILLKISLNKIREIKHTPATNTLIALIKDYRFGKHDKSPFIHYVLELFLKKEHLPLL